MTQVIRNGSVELYAETFGRPDDVPVLLIAGAMAPAVFWDTTFCQSLAASGYYVIRFDNRDIGRSTHFPQSEPGRGVALPYTIHDMVEDAHQVLARLSGKRGHIVGHSLGGSIAQLFAVAYPDQTRTVTALSTPILAKGDIPFAETDPKITEALWSVLMANPMHQDVERGVPAFRKVWRALNGDWPLDEQRADAYTCAIYATEVIAPAWNHTHVQEGIRDIFPELCTCGKPLLFVHGEHDYLPAHPENTRRLAGALPNAEVFILEKGGHMFFNDGVWQLLAVRILDHLPHGAD